MSRLRDALVQCAHILADALEADAAPGALGSGRPEFGLESRAKVKRQRRRAVAPPADVSDLDVQRARAAAKRAGVHLG